MECNVIIQTMQHPTALFPGPISGMNLQTPSTRLPELQRIGWWQLQCWDWSCNSQTGGRTWLLWWLRWVWKRCKYAVT